MPARTFESFADALLGVRGYRARVANAEARREARQAELNSAEYQERAKHSAIFREDHRLSEKIFVAEGHLDKLKAKLIRAHAQAQSMSERSYSTGDIHSDAWRVRQQIAGLPALIERAESELTAARSELAAHRARVEAAQHPVEPIPAGSEVDAVEPAIVKPDAPRGRGRPPKAAA